MSTIVTLAPASAGQGRDDGLGDRGDVVADAREEVAAAGPLDLLGRQPQRAVHDLLAQLGEHRLAEPGDERHAERAERGLGHGDAEQREPGSGDRAGPAPRRHPVDDLAEQQRPEQPGARGGDEHDDGDRRPPAPRPQQRGDDAAHRTPVGGRQQPRGVRVARPRCRGVARHPSTASR